MHAQPIHQLYGASRFALTMPLPNCYCFHHHAVPNEAYGAISQIHSFPCKLVQSMQTHAPRGSLLPNLGHISITKTRFMKFLSLYSHSEKQPTSEVLHQHLEKTISAEGENVTYLISQCRQQLVVFPFFRLDPDLSYSPVPNFPTALVGISAARTEGRYKRNCRGLTAV